MRTLKNFFISCGVLLLACLLAFGGWQLFGPVSSPSEVKVVANTPKHLQLTALGDSLTYGVGDATNNGGFVGLTKVSWRQPGNIKSPRRTMASVAIPVGRFSLASISSLKSGQT